MRELDSSGRIAFSAAGISRRPARPSGIPVARGCRAARVRFFRDSAAPPARIPRFPGALEDGGHSGTRCPPPAAPAAIPGGRPPLLHPAQFRPVWTESRLLRARRAAREIPPSDL
ncbi:hypothetical protein GCM10027174_01370 [Salinifilum aidingensis]